MTANDDGKRDDRDSDGRGLPVGVVWLPLGHGVLHLVHRQTQIAVAKPDGTFQVPPWDKYEHATPRPGETLIAAAQREAEAALWRVDGFGVGEVRGLHLPVIEPYTKGPVSLPGLSGLWTVTRWVLSPTGQGVEVNARRVDAVRVDVVRVEAAPRDDDPQAGGRGLTMAEIRERYPEAYARAAEMSAREASALPIEWTREAVRAPAAPVERVPGTYTERVSYVDAAGVEHVVRAPPEPAPLPYYDPVTGRCPHGTRYPHECRDGCEDSDPAPLPEGVACLHECPDGSEPAGLLCGLSFGHLGDHRARDEKGRPWHWTDEGAAGNPAPREPSEPAATRCSACKQVLACGCDARQEPDPDDLEPQHFGVDVRGDDRMPEPRTEPSAPTDAEELARLLPGLASKARTVIAETEAAEGAPLADYVIDVARACELLLAERERLAEEVAQLSARVRVADSLELSTRCAIGGVPPTAADPLPATTYTHDAAKALRARVAELEVEVSDVRFRHGVSVRRAFMISRRNIGEARVLRARVAEMESARAAEWPTSAHVRAVYDAAVAWEATELGSPAESAAADRLHETIALGEEVDNMLAVEHEELEAQRGRFVALLADMNRWWSAHNELASTAKDPLDARYQEGKAHGILHCLTAVEGALSGKTARAREPAGHRVAALLARLKEEASDDADIEQLIPNSGALADSEKRHYLSGHALGIGHAMNIVREHLGAPSAIDLAVAEVVACNPHHPLGLGFITAACAYLMGQDTGRGMAPRDRMRHAAAILLAGMLACAADGGKERA